MENLTPRKAMNIAWALGVALIICLALNLVFLAAVVTLVAGMFAGFAVGRSERIWEERDAEGK